MLAATACTTEPVGPWAKESVAPRMPVVPLQISADNLDRITVCTRPFRPAGPRIEAEAFGDKTVIHNYGHGGSGWSLSWACAEAATTLARQTGARTFAVIGAGVIGLTTAVKLAESGALVSIYAKDLPSESRSARATGVWSPSSRIALHDAAPAMNAMLAALGAPLKRNLSMPSVVTDARICQRRMTSCIWIAGYRTCGWIAGPC